MTVSADEQHIKEVLERVVEKHGVSRAALIPILTDANREIGYLPKFALTEICRLLKTPLSQIFSVACFYQMLSTQPRGKHVIQFCESAPCHVVGGRLIIKALQNALNVSPGETTPDGKWTLITTSCLGLCGVGPVIMVDDDVFGNTTSDQIPGILSRYN